MKELKKQIKDRLTTIAVFMQTSMGFPVDMFEDKIGVMSLLEQLAFVNGFAESHNKVVKPIYYKE